MTAPFLRNLTEALLILGVAFTVWWQPITATIPLKASDALFLLGLFACAALLCFQRFVVEPRRDPEKLLLALGILLASILAATLASFLRYHLPMTRAGLILLGRLAVCMMLFFAVRMALRRGDRFERRISLAFLSPLVLFPAMLIPSVAGTMWGADDHRFRGLTLNPNTADLAFVIAFGISYTVGMWIVLGQRRLLGRVFTAISGAMLVLIVWTQSRDYLFSTLTCALLGAAMVASSRRVPKWKLMIPTAFTYVGVVAAVLLLAPRSFTASFMDRILPTLGLQPPKTGTRLTPPPVYVPSPALTTLERLAGPRFRRLASEPHIIEFWHYATLVSTNYFGLGVNYKAQFKVYIPSLEKLEGANSIVDIPVYGGFGAVLSLGYFLYVVGANLRRRVTMPDDWRTPYVLGAGTALGGLWIAAVVLGSPLFDYQFWVLAAIALV